MKNIKKLNQAGFPHPQMGLQCKGNTQLHCQSLRMDTYQYIHRYFLACPNQVVPSSLSHWACPIQQPPIPKPNPNSRPNKTSAYCRGRSVTHWCGPSPVYPSNINQNCCIYKHHPFPIYRGMGPKNPKFTLKSKFASSSSHINLK